MMSRAFTNEDDNNAGLSDIGERPVSTHRNLVTRRGLAQIDEQVHALREALAKAEADAERERIALVSRDLRYWNARRETAELSEPEPDSEVIRFGMTITIEDEEGNQKVWTLVGEDEADAADGKISHAAPLAQALFGKKIGDTAIVNDHEWEIVEMAVAQ